MKPGLLPLLTLASLAACGTGVLRPAGEGGAAGSPPVASPEPTESPPRGPAPTPAGEPEGYREYATPISLPLRRIGRWTGSGIHEARREVIRDAGSLARFWSQVGAGTPPRIDFQRELVIAVASGQKPSGGHAIGVTQVTRTGGDLRIEVTESAPGPDCVTTSVLTQPVEAVVVPADGVTGWGFVEKRVAGGCT